MCRAGLILGASMALTEALDLRVRFGRVWYVFSGVMGCLECICGSLKRVVRCDCALCLWSLVNAYLRSY